MFYVNSHAEIVLLKHNNRNFSTQLGASVLAVRPRSFQFNCKSILVNCKLSIVYCLSISNFNVNYKVIVK